jgi:hypothetical protein
MLCSRFGSLEMCMRKFETAFFFQFMEFHEG